MPEQILTYDEFTNSLTGVPLKYAPVYQDDYSSTFPCQEEKDMKTQLIGYYPFSFVEKEEFVEY